MSILRRKPFTDYQEALAGFTEGRKILNDLSDNKEAFLEKFAEYKKKATEGNVIAMDIIAYFYKSGVNGVLPENYMRYINWEFLSAGRGNELAIEKLQFLLSHACSQIEECPDFQIIAYKNDITEYNIIYILGKALCKILVRDFLKAFPTDLYQLEDTYEPHKQEYSVTLRRYIDSAVPNTIAFLKS